MLSGVPTAPVGAIVLAVGLNAPFDARYFLTDSGLKVRMAVHAGLNSPFGARRFLTVGLAKVPVMNVFVLIHRLALGAF